MSSSFFDIEDDDNSYPFEIINGRKIYCGCYTMPPDVIARSIPRPVTPFLSHAQTDVSKWRICNSATIKSNSVSFKR